MPYVMKSIPIPEKPSIRDIVQKIHAGKMPIPDLIKEHIDVAKEVQEQTNAFITIFDSDTKGYDPLLRAKELQDKLDNGDREVRQMPLLGVPFTAKDLYLFANTRTTFASQYMTDFVAPYTATVLQKCLDAGAILIGKTNADPWGFGGSGENSGFGPTRNPYDLDRTPGGSSSGSAASLAAGVGFFSLGTDTGGSVRQPAAMCGLYGFKPKYGANSRYGISAMGSSFDTPGFFTRNADDIALLQNIMAGKDAHDATTHEKEELPEVITFAQNSQQTKKIGVVKEYFTEGLNTEVENAVTDYIDSLKEAGHEIVDISLPSVEFALAAYYILVPAEISSNRARYDGVRYGPAVSDEYEENLVQGRSQYFEKEVKRRIMIGTYVLQAGFADQYYNKATKVRAKIKQEFLQAFDAVDLLIGPTSPTTAFKLGEKTNDPVQMYLSDIYTVAASLAGIPALSIPIGKDSQGLPIGLQVMGR